jgi:uncharacterized membrane protein YsdA (DUF1294 family)
VNHIFAEILPFAPLYLVVISLATYFAFWLDKRRARQGSWRISESNLLFLALIGGSPAAIFAQQRLRHKTRKEPFRTFLFCIPGVQIGAIIALVVWFK